VTYQFHSEPFAHQLETFHRTAMLPYHGILWEQGTGKTKVGIDTACALWEAGEIDAVIVVAPNGVHRNWLTDEMPAHVPTRIRPAIKAEYWESSKAGQVGVQAKMKALLEHKGFSWLLMSYEGFNTERAKKYVWKFLRQRRVLYILDEAHNIKSPGAKRTKSIVASGKYAPYRRILTGTPVAQGPFDIYSQLKFLDDDFWKQYGFANFGVFKFHFGDWFTADDCKRLHGYDPGFDKLVRYKNIEQLNEILASVSTRVMKEDVLDLPPKLYSKRYHDMTKEQRQLYENLRDDFMAEFADGAVIDGQLAITRLLRLQQIVCGYAQTDGEEPIRMIGDKNPRLDLLEDIASGLTHQGIIWARFTRDIDQIMSVLGDKACRYDGSVTDDEAQEAKEAFQAGDFQWFVGNPQKGATGLTLVQAKTMVYYSNSFKLIDRLQSEDRAHRIGQDVSVNYIDLVSPGTVDEHIVRRLREKFDIAARITGDELRDWL
jgi:SNF2 family DNA or RNA helicase